MSWGSVKSVVAAQKEEHLASRHPENIDYAINFFRELPGQDCAQYPAGNDAETRKLFERAVLQGRRIFQAHPDVEDLRMRLIGAYIYWSRNFRRVGNHVSASRAVAKARAVVDVPRDVRADPGLGAALERESVLLVVASF